MYMPIFPWGGWCEFTQWCVNTVPTIFDDTLSYYEQICKLAHTVKGLINQVNTNTDDIENLKSKVQALESWKKDFVDGGTKSWDELFAKYFQTPFFVGLTDDGRFLLSAPRTWSQLVWRTTGYDMPLLSDDQYGHLVILY